MVAQVREVVNRIMEEQATPFQSFQRLVANDLHVDYGYQRPLRKAAVNRMAREFADSLFGTITVSKRNDGTYWILDGQHRVEAFKKLGKGHLMIPCEVLEGLSWEQEAFIFSERNAKTTSMTRVDRFRGALAAKDDNALRVKRIVEEAGFEINLDTSELSNGRIHGVSALVSVDENYRSGHLAETLSMIRGIWGEDVGPQGVMISGMAVFLSFYRGEYDPKRVIAQLSKVTQGHLHKRQKMFKLERSLSPQLSMCHIIVEQHNDGIMNKNKLPSVEYMRGKRHLEEEEQKRGK